MNLDSYMCACGMKPRPVIDFEAYQKNMIKSLAAIGEAYETARQSDEAKQRLIEANATLKQRITELEADLSQWRYQAEQHATLCIEYSFKKLKEAVENERKKVQ